MCETQGEIFLPVRSHPNHHFPRNDSCVRNEEKAKFAAAYAIHYQFNVQRELAPSLMFETGYVGVRGVKFILHRRPDLPDRLTGVSPNPAFGLFRYYGCRLRAGPARADALPSC